MHITPHLASFQPLAQAYQMELISPGFIGGIIALIVVLAVFVGGWWRGSEF